MGWKVGHRRWSLYDGPYFKAEFTGTGNHDEIRGSTFFEDDMLAYGNAVFDDATDGWPDDHARRR